MKVWSLNCWTAREVPRKKLLTCGLVCNIDSRGSWSHTSEKRISTGTSGRQYLIVKQGWKKKESTLETKQSFNIFFLFVERILSQRSEKDKNLCRRKCSSLSSATEKSSKIRETTSSELYHVEVRGGNIKNVSSTCFLWARPVEWSLLRSWILSGNAQGGSVEPISANICDHEGLPFYFLWCWTFCPQKAWLFSVFF